MTHFSVHWTALRPDVLALLWEIEDHSQIGKKKWKTFFGLGHVHGLGLDLDFHLDHLLIHYQFYHQLAHQVHHRRRCLVVNHFQNQHAEAAVFAHVHEKFDSDLSSVPFLFVMFKRRKKRKRENFVMLDFFSPHQGASKKRETEVVLD